jgi:hypothetical protein
MLCAQLINAQDIFKQHGFSKEPLTLSDGRYNEFFNNDEVVQIGTVLLNTKTNKVVAFVEEDTVKTSYLAEFSSRWLSIDPLARKYPQISPYVYVSNNPVNAIDPDGKDEFLLTWLPQGDAVGHSAVAIQERNSEGNLTGNVIVRHLWPAGGSVGVGQKVDADYRNEIISQSDLSSFRGGEGRDADGIIKITGDAHQDNVMSASLNLDEKTVNLNEKGKSQYEMTKNDCANYAKGGVESVGINGSSAGSVNVIGAQSGITYKSVKAVTPGSVHNAVANSEDKRVSVVKALPSGNGNPNIEIKRPDKEIITIKSSQ